MDPKIQLSEHTLNMSFLRLILAQESIFRIKTAVRGVLKALKSIWDQKKLFAINDDVIAPLRTSSQPKIKTFEYSPFQGYKREISDFPHFKLSKIFGKVTKSDQNAGSRSKKFPWVDFDHQKLLWNQLKGSMRAS